MIVSQMARLVCSVALTAGFATLADAQSPGSAPPNPTAPDSKNLPFDPKQTIPEKIAPADPKRAR